MRSLFHPPACAGILARLDALPPDAPRHWGKMNAAQMLAHCAEGLEVATGQKHLPRLFVGRLFGRWAKRGYLSDQPFAPNKPTDPHFVVLDKRDFEQEKARLQRLIRQFHAGGAAGCTTYPHSFFGKLTPQEWSIGMFNHLDHHLRQFGG